MPPNQSTPNSPLEYPAAINGLPAIRFNGNQVAAKVISFTGKVMWNPRYFHLVSFL